MCIRDRCMPVCVWNVTASLKIYMIGLSCHTSVLSSANIFTSAYDTTPEHFVSCIQILLGDSSAKGISHPPQVFLPRIPDHCVHQSCKFYGSLYSINLSLPEMIQISSTKALVWHTSRTRAVTSLSYLFQWNLLFWSPILKAFSGKQWQIYTYSYSFKIFSLLLS